MSTSEIIRIAHRMLAEEIDLLWGCRLIVGLHCWLTPAMEKHEALAILVEIDRGADDYPVGPTRELWDPAALVEPDRVMNAYLADVKPELLAACRRFVAALADPVD